MKKINSFNSYSINEDKKYQLPDSVGEPDKDEEVFWFSTKNVDSKTGKSNKSLILDLFFEMINISVESGKKLKDKEINASDFYVYYKSGSKNIIYTYEFWTEDEEVVKKSKGHFDGHEWQMKCEIPFDIIEKLNAGELNVDDAKKRIESESTWSLLDGMDPTGLVTNRGGWQLVYILQNKELDREMEEIKKRNEWKPQWLKKFSSWFTDKFA